MPVVAFDLPKSIPGGASTGTTSARRLPARSPAADVTHNVPAAPVVSFRQQLSNAAQQADTPARTPEVSGKSRQARSEPSASAAKPSPKSRRKQEPAKQTSADAPQSVDAPEATSRKRPTSVGDDEAPDAADPTDDIDPTAEDSSAKFADPATEITPALLHAAAATIVSASPHPAADVTLTASATATVPAVAGMNGNPALSSSIAAGEPSANASATGEIPLADDLLAGETDATGEHLSKRSAGVSPLGGRPAATTGTRLDAQGPHEDADATPAASTATPGTSAPGTPALAMSMVEQFAAAFAVDDGPVAGPATSVAGDASPASTSASAGIAPQVKAADRDLPGIAPAAEPETPVEARFAAANLARIASDVRGALMPNGGKMELRLDPPELGALQVSLHLKDGVVTASFQTQNPDAARLLSHTLGDLRSSLEAHGVIVDKLHVQQAPKDEGAGNNASDSQKQSQSAEQQQDSRREQQRKDMVQRLWDQLAGNAPIDVRA